MWTYAICVLKYKNYKYVCYDPHLALDGCLLQSISSQETLISISIDFDSIETKSIDDFAD